MDSNKQISQVTLVDDQVQFQCSVEGQIPFHVDYYPPFGKLHGYTSVQLVQIATSSCFGTAILATLRREGKTIQAFAIRALGTQQEEHPKKLTGIELQIQITSADTDSADMDKAIVIAHKICPLGAMLQGNTDISITYQIKTP